MDRSTKTEIPADDRGGDDMNLKDYEKGRKDGLLLALRIVRDGGLENLEKEIQFRNLTGIETALARKELDRASEAIKAMTIDTICNMSVHTLHDEFGFGPKRIAQFIARFQEKTDCLEEGRMDWADIAKANAEELGLPDLRIRYNI